jgi:hypothetical protein
LDEFAVQEVELADRRRRVRKADRQLAPVGFEQGVDGDHELKDGQRVQADLGDEPGVVRRTSGWSESSVAR